LSRSPALVIAALAAVGSVLVAGLLRLGTLDRAVAPAPEALVPLLLAVAALCVVGLARDRHPSVTWLSTIAALSLATVEIAAIARTLRSSLDADAWRWLSIVICLVAVLASGAAVAYAADRRRRIARWVPQVGGLVIVGILGACVWALATPDPGEVTGLDPSPLGSLSLVTRAFLVTVVLFLSLGLMGDARPAAARAQRRIAVVRPSPSTLSDRLRYATAWFWAFIDESSPGRSRAHRAAVSERTRIARDLHAEVVPAVRRALAEAERDGSVARLADSLRDVLHEVDALVGSEHAIQLEFGGLVPALEWLAERVEERSDVRVTLDVADARDEHPGEPPMEVAAAAFRVAGLALENVIRHAPGSAANLQVRVGGDRVHLVIADDGPGLPGDIERTAAAAGRRGLADMVAEASGCGASLRVDGGTGATADAARHGTTVTFDWPAGLHEAR
jgi:signal transduction histidine kinase